MASITSWTLKVHCIKDCNQIPMVVAQSLISNIKIHCVGACGVKRRSYQILNNYSSVHVHNLHRGANLHPGGNLHPGAKFAPPYVAFICQ